MKHRLMMLLGIGTFVCLCLAGCGNTAPETTAVSTEQTAPEAVGISISTAAYWEGATIGDALNLYVPYIEEKSGNTLHIEIHDGGSLGSDSELIPGAVQGTLSIVNSASAAQVPVVPEVALLGIPGMFENIETYNALVSGGYFDVLQGYYNQAGLQLLGLFGISYRNMTSNVPITDIHDIQGLKIRTLDNEYHIAFWSALGANASYYRFNGLYTVLQQGVYDAQENDTSAILRAGLYDVQKYMTRTRHVVTDNVFIMNKAQYDGLSFEHQALIEELIQLIGAYAIQNNDEKTLEEERILTTEKGMTILEPTEELMKDMALGREAAIRLLRNTVGDPTVDNFLYALAAAQKE